MISKTVVVWLMPAALTLATLAGNVWMALVYATVLTRTGLLTAGAPASGWLFFFGLLGANNMLALLVFAGWLRARRRDEDARDEVLAAVRWKAAPAARVAALAEGFAPPRVAARAALFPARHMPYWVAFCMVLCAPATALGVVMLA